MKYQLHHYYTPEEISILKAGRRSFEIIPSGMFLWLYDENYQYKFRVIDGHQVKLVDRVSLGNSHS